ncbi:MAG: hypothetical protein K2N73_02445 [Lachnospiraceae bacterium]|nr:hypothetical protein [Lachnospiraceae bacterium]
MITALLQYEIKEEGHGRNLFHSAGGFIWHYSMTHKREETITSCEGDLIVYRKPRTVSTEQRERVRQM